MINAKENLKLRLKDLQDAMGVSGHEQEVIKYVYSQIKPYADEVRVTTVGNVIAIKKGKKEGPNVLVGAHLDEVGFIVRNILPSGYILIDKVGGVPDNVLLGRQVLVSTKRIPGVIGNKPGHLQTPEESKKVKSIAECYVDLGVTSAAEVHELGIKVGDPVIFRTNFVEMANPDVISARAVDNKINCAVIIELFKNLNAEDFGGTLYGVFTVREEVGLFGAKNSAYGLDIDYALALDTIPAGDTPDINTAYQLPVYLGKGPAIPLSDGLTGQMYQHIHPALRTAIEEQAAEKGINLQICTLLGYAYATDAAAFSYVDGGVPTATITIPRRYSHSPVETFHVGDANDVLNLVLSIVKDNENMDLSFVQLP